MTDDLLVLELIREAVLAGSYWVGAKHSDAGRVVFEADGRKHSAAAARLASELCRRGPAPEAVG